MQEALLAERGTTGSGVIVESTVGKTSRNGAVVLDVRSLEEWNEGHVKGAKHVPIDELRGQLTAFAEETAGKTIYVHCKGGYRGHLALRILKEHGFPVWFGTSEGRERIRAPACQHVYLKKGGELSRCPPYLFIILFVCASN